VRADLQEGLAQVFSTLKKTVVLVTHDLGEAAFFGHTLVLMQGGRIVQEGSLKELQETPADPFVTRFLEAQGRLVV
jgi:osmoprotectant transport system ATP-binding protein